jgi:alkanesulfonate monooxygenase SsuD/methylene tetrahydromethanopterin reductase-like flavin-dependent oxidoreductase (luciferase family)
MKFGVQLHPELGADAVIREARDADSLGYDSVWLYDHLMNWAGVQTANFPLETLTLAAAIGAATTRARISWGVLNLGFYNPAVLAKALATIDQITHGRVICSAGSGWFKEESEAYNVPMIEDHDERSAAAYESVTLIKRLWANPAPQTTTFTGKYFRTTNLPFQPAPYQQPRPTACEYRSTGPSTAGPHLRQCMYVASTGGRGPHGQMRGVPPDCRGHRRAGVAGTSTRPVRLRRPSRPPVRQSATARPRSTVRTTPTADRLRRRGP